MSKFEIRYDIPVPTDNPMKGRESGLVGAFREMRPGGSVFVERPEHLNARNFMCRVHGSISYYRNTVNKLAKFTARTVEEDGKPGVRIFRLENRPEAE